MRKTVTERLAVVKTMYLIAFSEGHSDTESLVARLIADIEKIVDPHFTVTFECSHRQLKKILQAVNRTRKKLFFDTEINVVEIEGLYDKLEDTQYSVTMRYATKSLPYHR
jgi:hypothetical protein